MPPFETDDVTGIFKISSILWTDHMRYALVTMKFVRWPSSSHTKVILHNVSRDLVEKQLKQKYVSIYDKYIESGQSSPRVEAEMVSQLRLFHFKHTKLSFKSVFLVLDYFPVFSDSLEYEMTITKHGNPPNFLQSLIEDQTPMKIKLIHGIYRSKKHVPKQMILWMSRMQSNRAIRSSALKKYNKFVDWENIRDQDAQLVPDFREPRINHRSKMFIRNVIKDILDTDTAKLAPWIHMPILKLLSPLEKRILVQSVTNNIQNAFDFNFNIYSAQMFQLWFGHDPDKDFEDAIAFKNSLKDTHMYGICTTGPNKYITAVNIRVKQFVGGTGSMGVSGNSDVENKTFYTLKSLKNRYISVIERFHGCDLYLGTPDVPKGKCITYHPDDGIYWRSISDVDEVFSITQLKHVFTDVDEITIYAAHKLDFQHWVLLNMYLKPECVVHICGRLDQYCTAKMGQVFRDLVELKGYANITENNLFITEDIHFVSGIKNIPKDVQQVFTSSWSKTEFSLDRKWNKIWLFKPNRVRTIKTRNDAGWTIFEEQDEPPRRIYDLEKYKNADVIPINRWNGRLLDCIAYIPDPETQSNFDLYTIRTFSRKIYFVNMDKLPSDNGRLPSRRTLRHILET